MRRWEGGRRSAKVKRREKECEGEEAGEGVRRSEAMEGERVST